MRTVHTVVELRQQIAEWRKAGQRIAFVPTMGNLHSGHIELVNRARLQAGRTVASIFVNPLQFGPSEDFSRYPRTLPQDAAQLSAAGCDLLFAPAVDEIYPHGLPLTTSINVAGVSETLEGAFRPGHFAGVATVVNVLFNLVTPDAALFGEKDYQQLTVIRRMVRDLHLPIEIVGVPTQRASDGLALSSRNQYLSAEERIKAAVIYATMMQIAHTIEQGSRDFAALEAAGMQTLTAHGFEPQYVAVRALDLNLISEVDQRVVILVAAYLGKTRLIDNLSVLVENR